MLDGQAGQPRATCGRARSPAWKRHGGYVALVGILVLAGVAPTPLRSAADKQSVGHSRQARTETSPREQQLPLPFGATGGSALALQPPPPPPERESSQPAQPPATPQIELASLAPAMSGVPATVLRAYRQAAQALARTNPSCGLSVALLAAIGRVESGHAMGGAVDGDGGTVQPILGPRLDGSSGTATIRDTDGGRYDGDGVWDRAVGPMQFIPSTWSGWGVDGNGDGVASPSNVFDAALAAGYYLCAGNASLENPDSLRSAVLSYNGSLHYLSVVLQWRNVYSGGIRPVAGGQAFFVPPGASRSGSSAGGEEGASQEDATPPESREDGSAESEEKSPGRSEQEEDERGALPSPEETGPIPAPEASDLIEGGKKRVAETSQHVGQQVQENVDTVGQKVEDTVGGAADNEVAKQVGEKVEDVAEIGEQLTEGVQPSNGPDGRNRPAGGDTP